MAQERSKAGLTESASVQRIEVAAPAIQPGWYLCQGQAVFVFHHDNVLMARGYDFDTKTEWRRYASTFAAGELKRLVEA